MGSSPHVIADAHIYANQMKGVELQLKYAEIMDVLMEDRDDDAYENVRLIKNMFPDIKKTAEEIIENAKEALCSEPEFKIYAENPYDFFGYTADDCQIVNYKHMGKIDFGDVAV